LKLSNYYAGRGDRYYYQYLDMLEEYPAPLPGMTICEIYILISFIVQMGHDQTLKDCWSTAEQFLWPFTETQ
jgi:hypothetical protein